LPKRATPCCAVQPGWDCFGQQAEPTGSTDANTAGWTPPLRDRKIDQLASVISAIGMGLVTQNGFSGHFPITITVTEAVQTIARVSVTHRMSRLLIFVRRRVEFVDDPLCCQRLGTG
jgi:hypothetical protein